MNTKQQKTIHYISDKYNHIFIVAKTSCGKDWQDVHDSTSKIEYVTCKNCIKKNIK